MEKINKIKEVMKLLDEGKYVKIEDEYGDGTLWEQESRGVTYIYWHHFGQSAVRRNLKNLTWVINTIMHKKNQDFEFYIGHSVYGD